MERRLFEAAQKGNIDALNDLIGSNGLILQEMALEGDGHTPLHVACMAGHLDFVQGLLKLMPKFAEKVNAGGFSPLHIAAARGDVEIARELLRVGQHLCSVKGREGRIPLHYAVVNGELHVMKLLLSAWPESIEEKTTREETALHLAVKKNRFDVVVVLVEHLKQNKKEQVINWKDHKGNTALLLAVASKNFEVVDFMLRGHALESEVVEGSTSDESGSTPLHVLTLLQRGAGDIEIGEILAGAGARHGRGRSNSSASVNEDCSIEGDNSHQSDGEPVPNSPQSISSNGERKSLADIRNALLVVAALIAGATFQAMLQPPNYKGRVDSSYKKVIFVFIFLFMSFNTFAFLVSVQTIICLTRKLPGSLPLLLSMCSMATTYIFLMLPAPYTSMDISLSMKNMALFGMLPLIISFVLLRTQRWLAQNLDQALENLFLSKIVGDMYK